MPNNWQLAICLKTSRLCTIIPQKFNKIKQFCTWQQLKGYKDDVLRWKMPKKIGTQWRSSHRGSCLQGNILCSIGWVIFSFYSMTPVQCPYKQCFRGFHVCRKVRWCYRFRPVTVAMLQSRSKVARVERRLTCLDCRWWKWNMLWRLKLHCILVCFIVVCLRGWRAVQRMERQKATVSH